MLKLVWLGSLLMLVFTCCCYGMGTGLGDWATGRGVSIPGLSGTPGVVSLPGLGETSIQIGAGADFSDLPRYPGAQPAGQEVKLPGPVALAFGQLRNAGSEFRLYRTNATPQIVTGWYKQQLPKLGWVEETLPFQTDQANIMVFKKPGATGMLYISRDSSTGGRTQIMMVRAAEGTDQSD